MACISKVGIVQRGAALFFGISLYLLDQIVWNNVDNNVPDGCGIDCNYSANPYTACNFQMWFQAGFIVRCRNDSIDKSLRFSETD